LSVAGIVNCGAFTRTTQSALSDFVSRRRL